MARSHKGLKLVISKCDGQDRCMDLVDRAKKANMQTLTIQHKINFVLECKLDEKGDPLTKLTGEQMLDQANLVQADGDTIIKMLKPMMPKITTVE